MQAFFLEGSQRKLFAVYYPADQASKFILHIPAFAEEMNCARHIVSQQCRAFVEQGYSVLHIDLFGTGDSTGDFSEATWDDWKQDIEFACQWLVKQGAASVTLWGLRLGALLAIDCLTNISLKVDKLILWQPVLQGEQYIMQFLRLKTVASILDSKFPTVKVNELKQQLISGQCVEVAGYLLSPELFLEIMQLDALTINFPADIDIAVFDISTKNTNIPHKIQQFVEMLKTNYRQVSVTQIYGASFWTTHGVTSASELNLATLQSSL